MAYTSPRLALLVSATLCLAATRAAADGPIAPLDFSLPEIDNASTIDNAGAKSANLTNEATGVVTNEAGATWTGDAVANSGRILNQGTWNGSLANASGAFTNGGEVLGDVNNGGQFVNNSTGVLSGQLNNSGSATNNGLISGGVANSGTFVNNVGGSVGYVSNSAGTATNDGTAGELEVFGGNVVNAGHAGGAMVTTGGALQNSGEITGDVTAQGNVVNSGVIDGAVSGLGQITNNGRIVGAVSDGDLVNNSTGVLAGGFSSGKGIATNNGEIQGAVALTGSASLANNGTIEGDVSSQTFTGSFVNNGRIVGNVVNSGGTAAAPFVNNRNAEITGALTNEAPLGASNYGKIDGAVVNSAPFLNASSGVIGGGLSNSAGRAQNDGEIDAGVSVAGGQLVNNGTVKGAVGTGTAGALTNNAMLTGNVANAGAFVNNANGEVQGTLANSGQTTNSGRLDGAVASSGTFTNAAGGSLGGGLVETAGSVVNHGAIAGGVTLNGGALVSDGAISGGASIGVGATLEATGTLAGAIHNSGALAIADGSGALGRTLTLAPGSSLTGIVTIPVKLSTGQSNELLAKGANVQAASVTLSGNLANPSRAYWGALVFANAPIALSAPSAAALSALSDPLYAYSAAGGSIVQTVNPGLAGVAPNPVMAMLTTFNVGYLADPAEIARSTANAGERGVGLNLWTQAAASRLDVSATSSAGAGPSFNAARFATRVEGDQFGADAGIGDIVGSGLALHLGLVGAVAEASAADANPSGGSATARALSGGAYAELGDDRFFLAASARYQRFDLTLADAPLGLASAGGQAAGMSYTAEGGVRMIVADAVFVEPSAAAIVSRLDVGGQTANVGALIYAPLVSELGRLGLRIGTGLQSGAMRVEPYLSAQLWREFAGETTTYVQNGPTIVGSSAGAFSRLAFGLSASPSPNGLALFAEGVWTTGANVRGWGVNGGMRVRF